MYLISSPAPDFTGRQSWVPPQTFQTPRNKQRHPSRSPSKSSHTIRFDDIVLPSSPPMRIANRQRSLSPTKVQSESNLSPWRIRVTVEAEHEDDDNAQGSPRKKLKRMATTTKVPLKDEETSVSPKKPRGRPRKSDMQAQSATPIKGSPGRTPKTKRPSTGKRPRGRPRKSVQSETVAQSIEAADLHTSDGALDITSPTPIVTVDLPSDGSPSPERVVNDNVTGDIDTVNSDDQVSPRLSTPRDTREPQSSVTRGVRIIEGASELTPIKTLSAARRLRGVSPENTLHAGHTPLPRRIYPTPTSSSLVDDDLTQSSRQGQRNPGRKLDVGPVVDDPTDHHREFDTIVESEGFSMVSLDTLPSAKQGGLGSILSSAKGPPKAFSESKRVTPLDTEKLRASNTHSDAATNTSIATSTSLRGSQHTPAVATIPSSVPARPGPRGQSHSKRKRTFPSLVRVIRAGLALQGVLRGHRSDADPPTTFSSPTERDISADLDGPRQRLEHLFGDFGAETQRELRAGLRFGEQLVRRRMEIERLQRKQNRPRQSMDANGGSLRANGSTTGRVQQEIHWQRERETVSRQIENANPRQVIVIESDAGRAQPPEREAQEPVADEEEYEEDDFGDIWQQEARKRTPPSDGQSRANKTSQGNRVFELGGGHDPEDVPAESGGWISPVFQMGLDSWGEDEDENYVSDEPVSVWDDYDIPPLGKSRLSTLQQEDIDLSGLLRPQDTPNTKKYYGNSSPQTVEGQNPRAGVNNESPAGPAHPSSTHADSSSTGNVGSSLEAGHVQCRSDEIAEDEETPDASPQQQSVVTPQVSQTPSRASWFLRITDNFTPGWWVKAGQDRVQLESPSGNYPSEPPLPDAVELSPPASLKRSHDASEAPSPDASAEPTSKKRKATPPLATSGYFTDDHYRHLRRLYQQARQSPDLFPYHPSPRRVDMLDDWLWTSDGEHGLRVAAIQFGIVDRFVQDLSEADRRVGGRGEVGWSEEDLHKRLFSVIVGEQIRKERREGVEEEEARLGTR